LLKIIQYFDAAYQSCEETLFFNILHPTGKIKIQVVSNNMHAMMDLLWNTVFLYFHLDAA